MECSTTSYSLLCCPLRKYILQYMHLMYLTIFNGGFLQQGHIGLNDPLNNNKSLYDPILNTFNLRCIIRNDSLFKMEDQFKWFAQMILHLIESCYFLSRHPMRRQKCIIYWPFLIFHIKVHVKHNYPQDGCKTKVRFSSHINCLEH